MTSMDLVAQVMQLDRNEKLAMYQLVSREPGVGDPEGQIDNSARKIFWPIIAPEDARAMRQLLSEGSAN